MSRSARLCVFAVVCLAWALAVQAEVPADDDALLGAIREELGRAASQLHLENLDKPYYVEATVRDMATVGISASFGALTRVSQGRGRPLRVEVRVGSYELDSSEFVSRRSFYTQMMDVPRSLVVEDDVFALRHALWLAFDGAYK